MLLRRLRLVNYGGIYNGIGQYEINIDFTKCRNRLLIIKGDNGSGKTTIIKSLKPLPDDNSCFIKGKTAMKEIDYFDEITNTIYSIRFIHECKPDGSRSNTKGYIQKIIIDNYGNCQSSELNPSGNITSCKNIIFEEFQLDPNYITLTQLSNSNRGLADQRPADRKRYINAILSETDAYNGIHKKLSNKSLSYKSLMNSIIPKLQDIGDIGKLKSELAGIEMDINKLNTMNSNAIISRANAEGSIKEIDPDGYITTFMKESERKLKELENSVVIFKREKLKTINDESSRLDSLEYVIKKIEDIKGLSSEAKHQKEKYEANSRELASEIERIMSDREVTASDLQIKSTKLDSLSSGHTINELKSMISLYKAKIKSIENRWGDVLKDINGTNRDEIVFVIETFRDIHNKLSNLSSNNSILDIIEIIDIVFNNSEIELYNDIKNQENMISGNEARINELTSRFNEINSSLDIIDCLTQRPKECQNDSCPFIANAIKLKKKFEGDSLESLKNEIDKYNKRNIVSLQVIDYSKKRLGLVTIVKNYRDELIKIDRFIKKLKLNMDDIQGIMKHMCEYSYNESILNSSLYQYLDYANDLEEYKTIMASLKDAENKLESLSSQSELLDLLIADIERLNNKLKEDQKTIDKLNSTIIQNNLSIAQFDSSIKNFCSIIENLVAYSDLLYEINEVRKSCGEYREKYNKICKYIEIVAEANNVIEYTNNKLKPLIDRRDHIKYLTNLNDQYTIEFNQYKNMYDKIETLKHYSSPTTGIQLLFANIYMNKIMDKANNLIINLFDSQFALLPFIINESEFRIPVAVNNGINHPDITNMSSAQVALLSMIISISLLSQTSTRLNIIVGDEIDAPFDSENRRGFLDILYKLMNLVQASQCVLISHNSEIMLRDCDVIVLKQNKSEPVTEGNIIWNYSDLMK